MKNILLENYIKLLLESEEYDEFGQRKSSYIEEYPVAREDSDERISPKFYDNERMYATRSIKPRGKILKKLISLAIAMSAVSIPGYMINSAIQAEEENKPASAVINRTTAEEINDLNSVDSGVPEADAGTVTTQTTKFNFNSSEIDYNAVRDRLIEHEGQNNKPYYDSKGYLTIGIGTLITKEHSNTSMKNQDVEDSEEIKFALEKLSEQFPSIYTYTENDIQISDEQAKQMLDNKFNTIYDSFKSTIPDYEHLPKDLKEMLADMSYNMGANFFSGSSFRTNVKRLASLLKKDTEETLSDAETNEVKELIKFKIPKEFADSDYFDELTSHDADPSAAGRPVINNATEFNSLVTTYVGRPVNLLNVYSPLIDQINQSNSTEQVSEHYSIKKIYKSLFVG